MSSWMRTGLADAGAAEQADLAALGVGREQVDDLDARLEHLGGRGEVLDVRGVAVDRPALVGDDGLAEVDRLAEEVEDAPEGALADRDLDRRAGVDDLHAAAQAVGAVHGDRADALVAEVLLDLADEDVLALGVLGARRGGVLVLELLRRGALDRDRAVDLGELLGEDRLDHDALDLLDPADVALGGLVLGLGIGCGGHGVLR
jgi:hypothetical protein